VAEQQKKVGSGFTEGYVEADGFRIRYAEAGQGSPLVHLHGAGGLRLSPTHDLLARQFRVIAFEMPGFGNSPENTSTRDMAALGLTMARAAGALGFDKFNLWGTSFGGKAALWLAVQAPERLSALVLQAPAAILPAGAPPAARTPQDMARLLYGHPERVPPAPRRDPAVLAKQQALVARLRGPARDGDLEARMKTLDVPTLVAWGTLDRMIAPETARLYKELMPNCHLVLVYDAGHALDAERPEAFAEVVADFLERHEAFVISRQDTVIHP
jgi:4,5:9,10-diseco-3-hydroxy-5,9,17-trioxoandrosta-1(10),2-diene-4-oate hydrolase